MKCITAAINAAITPAIIAALLVLPAQARVPTRTVVGIVTHVTDGDTLWIKAVNGGGGDGRAHSRH